MKNRNGVLVDAAPPAPRDLLRAGSLLCPPFSAAPSAATTPPQGTPATTALPDSVLENAAFRLVIRSNGMARSLEKKTSRQECREPGATVSVFAMTQHSPLAGQLILLYQADAETSNAREVCREGDLLRVSFEGVPHEIAIRVKIAPGYMAFRLPMLTFRPRSRPTEQFN